MSYKAKNRLYFPEHLGVGSVVDLSIDKSHYLRNVIRLNDNDSFHVFNSIQGEFLAKLLINKKQVRAVIGKKINNSNKDSITDISLAFSPLKPKYLHYLIQKSTELGVSFLHPIIMSRTILKNVNFTKINKQLIQASEQCGRNDIPKIYPSIELFDFIQQNNDKKILVALEVKRDQNPYLSTYLSKNRLEKLIFLVGPEGGFSSKEIEFMTAKKNVTFVSLGSLILRAETAAIFMIAAMNLFFKKDL